MRPIPCSGAGSAGLRARQSWTRSCDGSNRRLLDAIPTRKKSCSDARVRHGWFSQARLQLAAAFGSDFARESLGVDAPKAADTTDALVTALRPEGPRVCFRAVAALRNAFPPGTDYETPTEPYGDDGFFDAVDDWLVRPCQETARAVEAEAAGAGLRQMSLNTIGPVVALTRAAVGKPRHRPVVRWRARKDAPPQLFSNTRIAWPAEPPQSGPNNDLLVAEAIRRELLPWILDRRDPVALRVQARGLT
ncbi:hypothetical protein OAX78_04675 [Planctomycetota bacterium]|nr:hypothetical protein [Planctomycetota bacterium]